MVLFKIKRGGLVRTVPPRPALLQLLMYMGLGGLSVDRLPVGSVEALLPVGNRTDLPLLQVFQVIEDIVHLVHGDVAVPVLFEEAAYQRSVLQAEQVGDGLAVFVPREEQAHHVFGVLYPRRERAAAVGAIRRSDELLLVRDVVKFVLDLGDVVELVRLDAMAAIDDLLLLVDLNRRQLDAMFDQLRQLQHPVLVEAAANEQVGLQFLGSDLFSHCYRSSCLWLM